VSCKIRYLTQRGEQFYYSRRLPTEASRNKRLRMQIFGPSDQYRVSLRTSCERTALERFREADEIYRCKLEEFNLTVKRQNIIRSPRDDRHMVELTPEMLDDIKDEIRERIRDKWRRLKITAELSAEHAEDFQREIESRETSAPELLSILKDLSESPADHLPDIDDIASHIIKSRNIFLRDPAIHRALVKNAVRDGYLLGEREVDDVLRNGVGRYDDLFKVASTRAPLISEVFAQSIAAMDRLKTRRDARNAQELIISVIGDKPLSHVSRQDIINFCRDEGSKTVGDTMPESVQRPISQATLQKKLTFFRSAVARAISLGQFAGENPVIRIDTSHFTRPPASGTMPQKRPLRPHELQKIFNYYWFSGCKAGNSIYKPGAHRLHGMHYWVPVIGALTGMRAAEIGGLQLSEIKLDDAYPHIEVTPNAFRGTKTDVKRLIPIIEYLDELGFREFVESRRRVGGVRLFEDWKPSGSNPVEAGCVDWANGKVIRAFNRSVIPNALGLDAQSGVRKEVTFHSLRGAFKTLLNHHEYNIPLNYINEVIGHQKGNLDKRYVGTIPIEQTYKAIHHCRYEGLTIPQLPQA
jgi:integrase